jgi:hypothetical protein
MTVIVVQERPSISILAPPDLFVEEVVEVCLRRTSLHLLRELSAGGGGIARKSVKISFGWSRMDPMILLGTEICQAVGRRCIA